MKLHHFLHTLLGALALFGLTAALFLPAYAEAPAAPAQAAAAAAQVRPLAPLAGPVLGPLNIPAGCAANYMVKSGDTLWNIGQSYQVDWPAIAQANGIATPDLIYAGTGLCIPSAPAAVSTAPTAATAVTASPASLSLTGVPTVHIDAVTADATVTLQVAGFPPNLQLDVRMGPYGTLGVNGTPVTTINSGSVGAFTDTFTIPAAMRGQGQIAVRLESQWGGYYAYNWFYNNSTP